MAEYPLIERYLDTIAGRLEHRSDAADLRDELADHLLESTLRAHNSGLSAEAAQQSTLDRFGDPNLVATALAAVPTKGIDMVHTLSRSAGILSLIVVALWLAVIFAGPTGLVNYFDRTLSDDEYLWQSSIQAAAVLVTGVALVALNVRVAGRVDALTGVVIGTMLFALVISFLFAWFFVGWGVYLAAGLAITIARMARTSPVSAPVAALLLFVVPILLTFASLAGLQLTAGEGTGQLTSLDQSRIELILFIVQGAISALLAAGFAILGVRLRGTTPPVPERETAIAA